MARAVGLSTLLRPSALIRRTAIRRGVVGDDRLWRVVAAVIFGRQLLRKLTASTPEVLAIEKLKPGQVLRVEAVDPDTLTPAQRKRWKTP